MSRFGMGGSFAHEWVHGADDLGSRPKSSVHAGGVGGNPNRGNNDSVSRKKVMPATRLQRMSMTCSAHGSYPPPRPLGRYWPNAGMPLACVATSFEPRQPMPGPSSHAAMSACPRNQSSYGGIDWTASSWSSATNDS